MGVGAHSYSHADLPLLPYEQQLDELVRSRETLEELVGHPVQTMAYPYGRYAERTQAAAREAGYELACANSGSGPWRALAVPREAVFPSTSTARLRLKAAGLHRPLQALRSLVPARRSPP